MFDKQFRVDDVVNPDDYLLLYSATESLPGKRSLERVEVRVERERAPEVITGRKFVTSGAGDHPGVIKELRVACAESERLFDGRLRFIELARFQRRPRQRVRAVDVTSHFKLFDRARVGFFDLDVVVGVKERELAVI